jgi:hypothetical protein
MKNKLKFPMLLFLAVLFANLIASAQSPPFDRPGLPDKMFVNTHCQPVENKEGLLRIRHFTAPNPADRLKMFGPLHQDNFLKNSNNTNEVIIYQCVLQ